MRFAFPRSALGTLALDLGVFHPQAHEVALRQAPSWSAVWVSIAYAPLQWRSALVPVPVIGANFGPWIVMLGAMMGAFGMIQVGVALFATAVLLQLVTLPVEFDTNRRAMAQPDRLGLVTAGDVTGSRSVLNVAAMTYVTAAAASVAYLLYYLTAFLGGSQE